MCKKEPLVMSSINFYSNYSLQQSAVAFRGKPSGKEIKKLYQALDKIQFEQYLNNPNIPKAEKMETVLRETAVKATEIFNESFAKKMLDKIMK